MVANSGGHPETDCKDRYKYKIVIFCEYEILTVFGLCSPVRGNPRSRLYISDTRTATGNDRSNASANNGCHSCNNPSTSYRSGIDWYLDL